MFLVARPFDQNLLVYLGPHCLAAGYSIIVAIIFDVDDIVGFDNPFNNCCTLMKLPFLRLWRLAIAVWVVKVMEFLYFL